MNSYITASNVLDNQNSISIKPDLKNLKINVGSSENIEVIDDSTSKLQSPYFKKSTLANQAKAHQVASFTSIDSPKQNKSPLDYNML